MLKPFFATTTLLLAALAGAQGKLDVFDAHCADIMLLQAKPVQTTLGITLAQRERMNKHADNHRRELAALEAQTKGKKIDPRPQLLSYYNELKKNVLAELTPAQVRRLREISLQRVGDAALCDKDVAARIGVSDAQLQKIQGIYSEGVQQFSKLEQGTLQKVLAPYKGRVAKTKEEAAKLNAEVRTKLEAAKKSISPQMDKLRASYRARMLAVLTSSQKAAYESLRGKPFHV